MATVDGLVCGRGDPFCSLTLSLSNPTTWIELKCTGGRDSALMADWRRGVGTVKTTSWFSRTGGGGALSIGIKSQSQIGDLFGPTEPPPVDG
uniref:Uncharacterized protein n=1 Tax=Oryza punctata TaxID=4537 RepID=A0A0E0MG90_ORYPU